MAVFCEGEGEGGRGIGILTTWCFHLSSHFIFTFAIFSVHSPLA
jgi:hypothetical protein